ncbi:hypothetical protein H920_20166 [Fukomys damarensis]|uniref:Uncharacterized protein n=1 Tax=Fukomys damarensis TaxID=885580 RepID=A0A091D6J6_FUKDA|nr:hypothetical protein H920_20166 [Fukomys damarensis]
MLKRSKQEGSTFQLNATELQGVCLGIVKGSGRELPFGLFQAQLISLHILGCDEDDDGNGLLSIDDFESFGAGTLASAYQTMNHQIGSG